MSLKRKRSNSIVDLTTISPPLPYPLTSKPLGPRADSPASSMSSRSSRGPKRRHDHLHIVDVDAPAKLIEPVAGSSHSSHEIIDVEHETSLWHDDDDQDSDVPLVEKNKAKHKFNENAIAGPSNHSTTTRLASPSHSRPSTPPSSNLLSTHTCPICFSTVTNACLTPCGHVLCGACLFASVKSGIQRALDMNIPLGGDGTAARCPVCRAVLNGWDGKGGGIIPLKIRTVVAL